MILPAQSVTLIRSCAGVSDLIPDAGLGERRGLLPDLPGPFRVVDARAQARADGAVGRAADVQRVQGWRSARASSSSSTTCGLGVNALYLTPIFSSASNHRYHTYDYFQVDPLLGGNDALFGSCSTRATRAGCASSSTACSTTPDVASGRSTTSWRPAKRRRTWTGSTSIGLAQVADKRLRPYPTPAEERRDERRGRRPNRTGDESMRDLGYRAWWDLPALPKLNTNNPHMREHLMGAAEHWLRFGIDGWRLDVAEEIDAGFWREFRRPGASSQPDAYIIAEIWREKPEWVTGDTFDAMMNYPLTEALLFVHSARVTWTRAWCRSSTSTAISCGRSTALGSRDQLEHIMTMYRPEAIRTPAQPAGHRMTRRAT